MTEDKYIQFGDWFAEEMQDEEFRAEYERLGPGFEVAQLRMLRGLTQAELAQRVGTHQSSISRLESGEKEPSLSFLHRVVEALNGQVEVHIVPREKAILDKQEDVTTPTTDRALLEKPYGDMVGQIANP